MSDKRQIKRLELAIDTITERVTKTTFEDVILEAARAHLETLKQQAQPVDVEALKRELEDEVFHKVEITWNAENVHMGYFMAVSKAIVKYLFTTGRLTTKQPEAVVPEGWKLVPIEPNEDIINVMKGYETGAIIGNVRKAWSDMLSAAPNPKGTQPEIVVPEHLCKDDQEQAIWQAIQDIKFGNKTDDKMILANLHKAGFYIAAAPKPSDAEV